MTTTATAAAPTPATPAAKTPANSLASLSNNYNDFLKLLMTQLQNQDPTAPMDTNQFTSQLVQFSSVEQQINTNTSLTKLIEATQGSTLLQSSSLVGQKVEVSGDQLSLQSGTAAITFKSPGAQPVTVGIYSATGAKLREQRIAAAAGPNSWTWDGKSDTGRTLPDGAYKAVVIDANGAAASFNALGTVTGMTKVGDKMKVQLGALQVDFASVQSVSGK